MIGARTEETVASRPLVAVHLSDIHFGQERGEAVHVNADARDQLVLAVGRIAAARVAAGRPPIGSIIITGDVAFSGQKSQYDNAAAWLARVSEAAGCDPLAVQVVPGNHDVDRGDSFMVGGLIRELFQKGLELFDAVLGRQVDRGALYDRLKAYQVFAAGYGCELSTDGGHAGVKMHELVPGHSLRILGLNSALICSGEESADQPTLMLGAKQRMIPEIPGFEHVVLVHHPMRWLRDGDDCQRYVDNRARVLMCGHEHRPAVALRTNALGEQLLVIDAGATVPDVIDDAFTYTFNVVEIDLAPGGAAIDVTVETWRWQTGDVRFARVQDDDVDGAPRAHRLACPAFAAAVGVPSPTAALHVPLQTFDGGEGANAAAAEEMTTAETIDLTASLGSVEEPAHAFARARSDFFHGLGTAQRIEVLVRLGMLPEGIDALSSNMMLKQLNRLNRDGRLAELSAAVAAAREQG